jgi:hypothetical protein
MSIVYPQGIYLCRKKDSAQLHAQQALHALQAATVLGMACLPRAASPVACCKAA